MAVILFDIFPSTGHLNAAAGLARGLQDKGHQVVFVGPASIVQLVHSFGFEHRLAKTFIFRMNEQEIRKKGKLGYFWGGILEYFTQRRYDEMISSIEHHDSLLGKLKPDLVILDEHFLGKAMYYRRKEIRLLTMQTTVATERGNYIPPFHSSFIPGNTLFSKIFIQYLWIWFKLNKRIRLIYYQLLSGGNDYFSVQKRVAKDNGFSYEESICFNQSKSFRFKGIPCLVTPPRGFDFPRSPNSDLFWINPLERPAKVVAPGRYQKVVSYLTGREYRQSYDKLIYCSFGSVTNLQLENSQRFFRKMVKVSIAHPEHRFILCIGKFSRADILLPTPPNMYVFSEVPQADLLAYCDIMITHGGVNSITECINAIVPMVVYPLFSNSDQRGNAARVVYHQLGVRGNIHRDSWRTISSRLLDVITHWDYYYNNVQKMKAQWNQANDSNALTIVENILDTPSPAAA